MGKGFIPTELADHHYNVCSKVLNESLNISNLRIENVDVIAFSQGMGIPNSLKVGAALARYLSLKYNKPLVGVNHGVSHIEIGKLKTGAADPGRNKHGRLPPSNFSQHREVGYGCGDDRCGKVRRCRFAAVMDRHHAGRPLDRTSFVVVFAGRTPDARSLIPE